MLVCVLIWRISRVTGNLIGTPIDSVSFGIQINIAKIKIAIKTFLKYVWYNINHKSNF